MENVNIGIVNLIISNKLKDSYFNEQLMNESKQLAFDLFNVVKNSPILQLEFKVFSNIESKHIDNDQIATRYIDNNIKLFEVYTNEEIEVEHQKLHEFIHPIMVSESIENRPEFDDNKLKLYNSISTLIKESLNDGDEVNVDNIHEAFTYVLNHVKSSKRELIENVDVQPVNEDVIEIAVNKFNEKYSMLDESDKNLLKTLIKSTPKEKQALLESYKTEVIALLENKNDDDTNDHIQKAIQKIKEMVYNRKSVDDNIINLYEFKKEIL